MLAEAFDPALHQRAFDMTYAWDLYDAMIEIVRGSADASRLAVMFAVLAATLPGMPLVYNGQESWLDKRLEFFDKDPIEWKDFPLAEFYSGLLRLKTETSALWNGAHGGDIEVLCTGNRSVFAFERSDANRAVTVVANLSNTEHQAAGADAARSKSWPPGPTASTGKVARRCDQATGIRSAESMGWDHE